MDMDRERRSRQADVEMLSVEALEAYAARHQISSYEANALFRSHQVYEKILVQHEYLHQVSFEEVMDYVEECIQETVSDLIVFHGTTSEFSRIDLSRSHNRRDFGRGFYTTVLESQAREWGYRLSRRRGTGKYYVYQYQYLKTTALKVLRFDAMDRDWLEFIRENRVKGGLQHDYDVVTGPVADDRTMRTIQLYVSGELAAGEAIERLRYEKVNNQISFHTEKALRYLRYIDREYYA